MLPHTKNMVSFSRGKQQDKRQPTWYKSSKIPKSSKETLPKKTKREDSNPSWESQASSKSKLQVNWKVVGDFQYRIRRLLIVLPQTAPQISLNCGILFCELSPVAASDLSFLSLPEDLCHALTPSLRWPLLPKGDTRADTWFSHASFWFISSLSHV